MYILKLVSRVLYDVVLRHLPSSMSRCGGKFYKRIRATVVKNFVVSCGKNVNIEHGAVISSKVRIGDNSGIGINCVCSGPITLGNNVMMGPECVIFTRNHAFDRTDIPMCEQGFQESREVTIGDDVWIGRRVMIMPGVHIGTGVIIGAGSVVTKDIPDWAIAAGNPAIVKKYRKQQDVSSVTGNQSAGGAL